MLDSAPFVTFVEKSENKKLGPIPASMIERATCPPSCAFMDNGCYGEHGPIAWTWKKLSSYSIGMPWGDFLDRVFSLPAGQLWRHAQVGDLPGRGDQIDHCRLEDLVTVNHGKRGFTYTHKPLTTTSNREAIAKANAGGFVVNLSANNLKQADEYTDLGIAPVVTALPRQVEGKVFTPAGRPVVVCPAQTHDNVTCMTCRLCARPERPIIGFLAHGSGAKRVEQIAVQLQ
jgi:hypothetical protein